MTIAVDSKWAKVALGVLAELRNGINYNKDNFGKGIKVINVKDFQDYSIASFEGLDEVNPSGVIKEKDLLKNGDIIFVRSNGNRELIGRSLFIQGIHEPITHSAFTIKLRFTSNRVLPRFYAYLFRTSLMRQTLSAHGNGTNISNLNQGILTHLQVPLPPLLTQKKIVGILSAYDRIIENNNRRINILEEMARSLYDEWFVKFRFPGYEQTKMVDSGLGLIPKGWEVKKIKDIIKRLKVGTTYKEDSVATTGIVPIIDQSRNDFLGFHNNKPDHLASSENPIIIFGDHTCKLRLVVEPFSLAPNVVPFLSQHGLPITYLYFLIYNLVETKEYKRHWNELTNKMVALAPTEYTQKFASYVKVIFEQINCLLKKNLNLCRTRDLLLPKLISGEIDVENLDIETGAINESEVVSSSSQEAIAG